MKREIVFDQAFFEALKRLEIVASTSSGGRLEGARVSARTGAGIEFADWRPYAPGDNPREIDYRAFARLGKLYVRVRAREEASEVYVLVDATQSMSLGRPSKFVFARRVGAALAAIGLARMDALTIGLMRDGRCELADRLTGTEGVPSVLQFLEGARLSGQTDIAEALGHFLDSTRASGVLVVLSDFWSEGDLRPVLRQAAERGFEGSLIQTLAPEEVEPVRSGRTRMVDVESGSELELVLSPATRKAYAEERERFFGELSAAATGSGFRALGLRTDETLEDAVLIRLRSAGVLS
jgi:uncharacterized protein (DUF58 family)